MKEQVDTGLKNNGSDRKWEHLWRNPIHLDSLKKISNSLSDVTIYKHISVELAFAKFGEEGDYNSLKIITANIEQDIERNWEHLA